MGKADPEDVVDAMHEHPDPVVTATELAEQLPVTARTIQNRLRELAAAEKVERKEVGGRAVVYWLPGTRKPRPDAKPRERSLAPDQADLEDAAAPVDGEQREPVDETDGAVGGGLPEHVEAAVGGVDLPGSGERVEQRREAVRACLRLLREQGDARRSVWQDEVYPDHPAGYGSEGGWWNTIGKKGLAVVAAEVDAVDAPGEGEHVWYWTE